MERAGRRPRSPDDGEALPRKQPEPVDLPPPVNGRPDGPPEGAGLGGAEHNEDLPPGEDEPWETTFCPLYGRAAAAALSFATVRWDTPGCHEEEEEDGPSKVLRSEHHAPRDGPDTSAENGGDTSGSCDLVGEQRARQEVEHPAQQSSECVSEAIKSPNLEQEEEQEEEQGEEEREEGVPGRLEAAAAPSAGALPFPEEVLCSGPENPETPFFYMTLLTPGPPAPPPASPRNAAEGEEDEDHRDEERRGPQAAGPACVGLVEAQVNPEAVGPDAAPCWERVGVATKEELPEPSAHPDHTPPGQRRLEGFYLQGTGSAEGKSASLRSAANGQCVSGRSAEGPASAGSRLVNTRPSESNLRGSGEGPQRVAHAAELEPRGARRREEVRPEGGETERSGRGQEGSAGKAAGGAESSGLTPTEARPEGNSEPDRTADPGSGATTPERHTPPGTPAEGTSAERSRPTREEEEGSESSEGPDETDGSADAAPHMNGGSVDRQQARRLAQKLFLLQDVGRLGVVRHMDKDNDFSRAVGEEFLSFFDFSGQTLDHALRSFLGQVVLVGESQERERVLQHFSARFHQCNPDVCSSPGAVLTLTCAMMLLNTDLHGQNVGKAMSSSSFLSNMEGMNDGENFNKELLKSFYSSIKGQPLQWAVDEEELLSGLQDEDLKEDSVLRSKSNPFQDVPHDKTAMVFKQGFLQRKAHADIDGKRTPWGKRSWKTFYGVLKGLVLYFQKDDHRKGMQGEEEVVSVHHALAEEAADYTKKPHVFRLQTADWRVFLFQASSKAEMSSWICRINLVAALHSSPPFPAAVGSQKRFTRPILPASQSAQTLERQLHSHAGMLESFETDLNFLQQNIPEGRKPRAKELEELRLRKDYLLHEKCRYQGYMSVLEAWRGLGLPDGTAGDAELRLLDRAMFRNFLEDIEEESDGPGMKKSVSSPSLELETLPPVVKVRRNVSERRTYRREVVARRHKDL